VLLLSAVSFANNNQENRLWRAKNGRFRSFRAVIFGKNQKIWEKLQNFQKNACKNRSSPYNKDDVISVLFFVHLGFGEAVDL
jgi:hypothetical protein